MKKNSSKEDKALDFFAEVMIEKIKKMNKDWKKPWFTGCAFPVNANNRPYNGMNAIILSIVCEENNYPINVWLTINKIGELRKKYGDNLKVNKGEKSTPVFVTTYSVRNNKTGDKISYEEWKSYDKSKKKDCSVRPGRAVYNVFNISQTNIKEEAPQLYCKLESYVTRNKVNTDEMFSFNAVDIMIEKNLWICPITPKFGDNAYYSISENEIVVPEKKQFDDGESFYSNLFHEMAHSTGAEKHLNRLVPASFGSDVYAKEELVAELTAALTSMHYGIAKHIKDDSAAYLKNWINKLEEEPHFIKTVLNDVKKAHRMICEKIDSAEICDQN